MGLGRWESAAWLEREREDCHEMSSSSKVGSWKRPGAGCLSTLPYSGARGVDDVVDLLLWLAGWRHVSRCPVPQVQPSKVGDRSSAARWPRCCGSPSLSASQQQAVRPCKKSTRACRGPNHRTVQHSTAQHSTQACLTGGRDPDDRVQSFGHPSNHSGNARQTGGKAARRPSCWQLTATV